MAATATTIFRSSGGEIRVVDVLFDNSYPAGGYALTSRQLGFGSTGVILAVLGATSKGAGWEVGWDYANAKLQAFDSSGAANAAPHEVAATTDLSAVTARLVVLGQGQG